MIDKLSPNADNMVAIAARINALIDAYNTMTEKIDKVSAEIAALTAPKSYDSKDNLFGPGAEMYASVTAGRRPISDALDIWNVNFYDDVEPVFESPVYCRNCEFRSQTLLDRMMLNPKALCEGCAYRSAHG